MGSAGCAFSALGFRGRFSAATAFLLIFLFLIPADAPARSRPLDVAAVHSRIVKRGIGNLVGVEENTGVILAGRILAINSDSFTMQLFNDPQPVTVMYADVTQLRTGASRGFWIATGAGIAAMAGLSIWGFVHVHDLQHQDQLPMPQPGMPALP